MPLSYPVAGIALLLKVFPQHLMIFGNLLPLFLEMKQCSACVEHRPTGHADGAAGSAGNMRPGEARSAGYQRVDIGCMGGIIAEGSDCIEALIVSEQEKYVGKLSHYRILSCI